MLYALVRFIARVALDWFYGGMELVGAERLVASGPLLIAVNHPNQLIDALVVLRVSPRRVRLTGKATLFASPIMRLLLRWYGVVPLRRARDEAAAPDAPLDPARNLEAFRAIVDTLERRRAVLIFPEGRSHHEPKLAPLRTGIARIALQACEERGITGLRIQPIGLVFEAKWAPRTRILVNVGEALDVDQWCSSPQPRPDAVDRLTAAVEARLRDLTLNFASAEEAERTITVARVLHGVFTGASALGERLPLLEETRIAKRVSEVGALATARAPQRVATFLERLDALAAELQERGIPPGEIAITPTVKAGARFALRESAIAAAIFPAAWWGRINHWLPLELAQAVSRRTSRTPEDPAMHTIIAGIVLVLLAYAAQGTLVAALVGPWWALAYLVSLPAAASLDLRLGDRLRRARARVRAYLTFRSDPELHARLRSEIAWIRQEALELESIGTAVATS
jgi:1-acyl-sn-glycerol-3-phosphate acyltransferase